MCATRWLSVALRSSGFLQIPLLSFEDLAHIEVWKTLVRSAPQEMVVLPCKNLWFELKRPLDQTGLSSSSDGFGSRGDVEFPVEITLVIVDRVDRDFEPGGHTFGGEALFEKLQYSELMIR